MATGKREEFLWILTNNYIETRGLKEQSSIEKEHLKQFISNYDTAFSEYPTPEQIDSALQFVGLFFSEIMECYSGTQYAASASRLSTLIGESAIETARNVSGINSQINENF